MNKQCIRHFLNGAADFAIVAVCVLVYILWTVFCGVFFSFIFGVDKELSILVSLIINGLITGGLMEAHTYGCFKRE